MPKGKSRQWPAWEDGTHRFDLAEYRNGRVTWQGWDYKP